MEAYEAAFADLLYRELSDLSEAEHSSLDYYYAAVNIAEGIPADSVPRFWCLMAQNLSRVAFMLGRLPVAGDPGATPELLTWLAAQSTSDLNSYQKARLSSLPGYDPLASEQ